MLVAVGAQAEEGILWKSGNPGPANVVPTYTNQTSPFPMVALAPVAVSETAVDEALLERQRLRDEAFGRADTLVRSGGALQPMMNGLRVGGMLDGTLGARVLLNDQWVGKGSRVKVRQVKSITAVQAIQALKEYDPDAAAELSGTLNAELTRNYVAELVVSGITSRTLVLTGAKGVKHVIDFEVDK
jgi:hypothetical protein